jgi:hypothetical protein
MKSINISNKPDIVENVLIRLYYSPEEVQIYTYVFKEYGDTFFRYYE